eukprot:1138747-Pelagomonas_calceolata.AAC.2
MSSWAALVSRSGPVEQDRTEEKVANPAEHKTCVLDANALISGGALNMLRFAEKFYTIQEVFDEIRDKQSRQYLQTLPFTVEVKDYTEESLKAGECVRRQMRGRLWRGGAFWRLYAGLFL